jgi:uncharacterized membrane protein
VNQPPPSSLSDERIDQVIGNLLRTGVILATTVVLVGGIVYLIRHGSAPWTEPVDYRKFQAGAEPRLGTIPGVIQLALSGSGRGIIQLGLLLLIATPVARVVFSAIAFAVQRDKTYVIVTLIVLSVLIFSLFAT